MRILIGIDDTDIITSRGTGYHARELGKLLEDMKLGYVQGITRHQLLVDPRIPYTSHNSSACLEILAGNMSPVKELCRDFLITTGPQGCDSGLCIAEFNVVSDEIVGWGERAKREVLDKQGCLHLARREKIFLEGLAGTHDGIIGAMAAVGLRKGGNDGRFLWLRGNRELRDLAEGIYTAEQLMFIHNFDSIETPFGEKITGHSRICLSDWTRPVLRNGKAILLVGPSAKENDYEWKAATKEYIKSVS